MSGPRTVLISGGSRGLGLALVNHFLDRGDFVAAFSRRKSESILRLENSKENQKRFFFEELDICHSDKVRQFVEAVHKRTSRLDLLINNAAVAHEGLIATTADAHIKQVVEVNLTGALLLAKWCSRLMLLQSGGTIINIGSVVGLRGYAGVASYSASKGGLMVMTRSLARELGPKGIRVNSVAPGFLETEMSASLSERQRKQIASRTPLGRLGDVQDVIRVVDFLSSEESSFITGEVISVDGGFSC